jgi:hypothetical protein
VRPGPHNKASRVEALWQLTLLLTHPRGSPEIAAFALYRAAYNNYAWVGSYSQNVLGSLPGLRRHLARGVPRRSRPRRSASRPQQSN